MTLVTIAICSNNRPQDVGSCLKALYPQARKAGLPVMIVDSGSGTAEADELVRLAAQYGTDYLRLDMPGLSRARNVAHDHARSEWIVYLDDDAIPEPDWAEALVATLSGLPANVAIVGGKILPRFIDGLQPRITDRWKLLLSCVDREGRGLVADGFNICGANFAVRRAAIEMASRFPLTLGHTEKSLVGGEESYLIECLSAFGLDAIYDDTFVVQHCIQPERLERRWAGRRAYWEGVSRIRIMNELGMPSTFSTSTIKLAASLPVLLMLHMVSEDPDWTIRYNMALGALSERLALHPRQKTPFVR
jgi:glycosyltransferase involved in cell wall biosynthesis